MFGIKPTVQKYNDYEFDYDGNRTGVRCQRRQRTKRYQNKQLKLRGSRDLAEDRDLLEQAGRFKKQAAWDCGLPKCPMCSNPRRRWSNDYGSLTRQELRFQEYAASQYEEYATMEPKGPEYNWGPIEDEWLK